MKVGYTTGVFDLFHIGHVNILRNARAMCDRLIVGVTTDELVSYKNKKAIIPFNERYEIIKNLKSVDCVVPQEDIDKFEAWKKLKFDILFVGDDWYKHSKWEDMERKFKEVGVKVVYFPYTRNTSSTLITKILQAERAKIPDDDKNEFLNVKEEFLSKNHSEIDSFQSQK